MSKVAGHIQRCGSVPEDGAGGYRGWFMFLSRSCIIMNRGPASFAEPLETEVMQERWANVLARDPYYNPNLSRERADFSLGD